jgi:hypothetical protein
MRIPRTLATLGLIALLPTLSGCPRDEPVEEPPPAAPAEHLTPEQQMQTALQRLVAAQGEHFRDHDRYTDTLQVLIDEYGFAPVGDAHVAISFAGTEPQWGYVASSVHPFSNLECEVLHGRASDGRIFAGEIECEAEGPEPPTPPQQVPTAPPGVTTDEPTGEPIEAAPPPPGT